MQYARHRWLTIEEHCLKLVSLYQNQFITPNWGAVVFQHLKKTMLVFFTHPNPEPLAACGLYLHPECLRAKILADCAQQELRRLLRGMRTRIQSIFHAPEYEANFLQSCSVEL